jgi:hypothetical protein
MRGRWIGLMTALAVPGCGHSDAFLPANSAAGPFNTGTDIRLTLNPDQDYWPAWTDDGRGILYAFVNPVGAGIAADQHRCMGILPAAGGSRTWQFCDDRAVRTDSVTSYTAYALGTDGRFLYAEAVAPANSASFPRQITLWLADTAHPLNRTALLTLPAALPSVTWLADLAWTGPNSFIALGQVFASFPHCSVCFTADSVFINAPGTVVIGTISGDHATLQPVTGTDGATGYSLAEGGASIVFIRRDDAQIYKVPVGGGTAVATQTGAIPQLVGVSCKGSTCLVATDALIFSNGDVGPPVFPAVTTGPKELRAVSLSGGAPQVLRSLGTSPAIPIIAVPKISPTTGDVVVQIGGVWGHLQTNTGAGSSDLHLYPAIVP